MAKLTSRASHRLRWVLPLLIGSLVGWTGRAARAETPRQVTGFARSQVERLFFRDGGDGTEFARAERTSYRADGKLTSTKVPRLIQTLAQHATAEASRLLELSLEQQGQYRDVANAIAKAPEARIALQLLLLEGKLTLGPRSHEGKTLLDGLATMATGKLARDIDRQELLSSTLLDVTVPTSIHQGDRGTCAVTTIQVLTASTHPAEYAGILAGLASDRMQAELANRDRVTPNEGAVRGERILDVDDQGRPKRSEDGELSFVEDRRALTSRLWQPAMMDYGNGPLVYDNRTDENLEPGTPDLVARHGAPLEQELDGGLDGDEEARVLDGVTGRPSSLVDLKKVSARERPRTLEALVEQIQARTDAGHATLVGLDWRQSEEFKRGETIDHAVLVTGIRHGRVYYANPLGAEESMTLSAFRERLEDANLGITTDGW